MSYLLQGTTGQMTRTGENQVRNNAGGFVYAVDPFVQLDRFLILGTQNGTYYTKQQPMTIENASIVQQLLNTDPERVVARIKEISVSGRAPKQDTALYALAMAASHQNVVARKAAFDALIPVCRTLSHLYQFLSYADTMRGWGMGLRKALVRWLRAKSPDRLAYQVVKYRSRYTWSSRDILRKTKPTFLRDELKTNDERLYDAIFRWIARGWGTDDISTYEDTPIGVIASYENAKAHESTPSVTLAAKLPFEGVPTAWRTHAEIWRAMLPEMGMIALIRNLATMTRIGVFNDVASLNQVLDRLTDKQIIGASKTHPVQFLSAWLTYQSGRSVRGDSTWTPNREIVNALETGFYFAFGNVKPANVRVHVGLDVSGSMAHPNMLDIPGLTPRVASGALAMIQWRTEQRVKFNMFSDNYKELDMKKFNQETRLKQVLETISNLPFQRTDCSLPMRVATKHQWEVDAFVIYTDNETWYGDIEPMDALKTYRDAMGIDAKLITVGMTATGFTIGDPNDAGTLDVVGFDLNVPALIADFARERIGE